MKNIQVLPTDKPSRLKQNKITKKLSLVNKGIDLTAYKPFNINITSNKKPQKGCYYICNDIVKKCNWLASANGLIYLVDDLGNQDVIDFCKKIILTTDQDLIKDGIQAIDDEFLEWFIKNPSCEEVEVENSLFFYRDGEDIRYKIIIPKEEPKQERMYSEEEVELIANEMVNWAIDNIGNPFPQSGKKFDEVISKYKKQ